MTDNEYNEYGSSDEDDNGSSDEDEDDSDSSFYSDADQREVGNVQTHLEDLCSGASTVLKIEDERIDHIVDMLETSPTEAEDDILKLCCEVMIAIEDFDRPTISEVLLETWVLHLWYDVLQKMVYQCLADGHSDSICSYQLGTSSWEDCCKISANVLLPSLIATSWPCMTNFQLHGCQFASTESIQQLAQFFQSVSPTLQTFNILGIVISPHLVSTSGNDLGQGSALLDSLLNALGSCPQLNDLQLHRMVLEGSQTEKKRMPPLVSTQGILHLLQFKLTWLNLTLDGMGLQDAHVQVLGSQLVTSKVCPVQKELSLRNNPNLSKSALSSIYFSLFINKPGMGRAKSDDANLNALIDLVYPLNECLRRLENKDDKGNFASVDKWLAWFDLLASTRLKDEARELNYIWFSVMEEPTMIATAINDCSSRKRTRRE